MKVEYTSSVLKRAEEMRELTAAAMVCGAPNGLTDALHGAILAVLAALSLLIPVSGAALTLVH